MHRLTLFGDITAEEHEWRQLSVDWDFSKPCCLKAGAARQLKKLGYSSFDFRQDNGWRVFWREVANIISMQVCDLEWRHGRNRNRSDKHGKTRHDTFTASTINAEAKLQHAAQKAWLQSEKPASIASMDKKTSLKVGLNDILRQQTAEELHRREWFTTQKQLGRSVSSACPDSWGEWRCAFIALSPTRLASFQAQSELTVGIARANRKKRDLKEKLARDAETASFSAELPRSAPPVGARFISLSGYRSNPLPDLEAFRRDTTLISCSRHPLSEEAMHQHGPVVKACESFKQHCMFSQSYTEDTFPDKVTYPGLCGSLCDLDATDAEKQMYKSILRAFEVCSRTFGFGAKLARADVILALEVWLDDELMVVQFVDFREAHGSNGINAAGQTFIDLECLIAPHVEDGSVLYEGVVLRYFAGRYQAPANKLLAPFCFLFLVYSFLGVFFENKNIRHLPRSYAHQWTAPIVDLSRCLPKMTWPSIWSACLSGTVSQRFRLRQYQHRS